MEKKEIKQKVLEDVDPEIHRLKKKERRKYRALVTVEFAALIAGILLLTGHGDFLLKGGNAELRKAKYDEAKMTKGSGVALILIGILTGIDSYTEGMASEIIYVILLLLVMVGLGLYLKYKCKKK